MTTIEGRLRGAHRSRRTSTAEPSAASPQSSPSPPAPPPGPDADLIADAPPATLRQIFLRFWPYTRSYRRWLAVGLLFVLAGPLLDAAGIWLFKVLIDDVLTPRRFGPFPKIAAAYVVITVLVGLTSFASGYLSVWLGERFVTDLRARMYRHLHSLSLDFFEQRPLGDLLSRLSSDIAAIEAVVLSGLSSSLALVFQAALYAGVLFYLQWQLALLAFVVTPLFWLISRAFSRRRKLAARASRRSSAAMNSIAEQGLANVALVQAYNRQDWETHRFHQQNLISMRAQLRTARLRGVYRPLTDLIELCGLLLVIGFGTWQLTRGRLTLGELLVFMAFYAQLASPVRGMGRLSTGLASAVASAERVVEVLDAEPSVTSPPNPRTLGRARGAVALTNVRFSYPGSGAVALDGINISLPPGGTLAIVGPSGAGKSTIAKLLLRFYDPDSGTIGIDGHDLRTLDLTAVRDNVAVVMQETLVFDASIRDNLLWGCPDATQDQLGAAARAADLDTVLDGMAQGYDTRVGQRGRRLSGGERQRVAIARAMLRDAPILLLDEPTTGLDPATSHRVLEPLRRLMNGRTTIIISHDLSTVRHADVILVIERGREVERGTHAQLLAAGGPYARLYRLHLDETSSAASQL